MGTQGPDTSKSCIVEAETPGGNSVLIEGGQADILGKQQKAGLSSEGSDSDDDYSDDNMDASAELMMNSLCLFCAEQFDSLAAMYVHCYNDHGFNIVSILKSLPKLEQIHYAILVNFIRAKAPTPEEVNEMITANSFRWNDEEYVKSVKEDDGALCLDVTEDLTELLKELGNHEDAKVQQAATTPIDKGSDTSEMENLRSTYLDLLGSVHTMRTAMQRILEDAPDRSEKDSAEPTTLSRYDEAVDSCYNRLAIHAEMLKDEHRTLTYIRALDAVFDHLARHKMLNSVSSLLDVGCGTGILALAAMRAATNHGLNNFAVFAVDRAQQIIEQAKKIAKQNGARYDEIQFINDSVEHCRLPVKKVDILISEWMGYGLFSECMLDSVITARDRFLKSDGLILPHQCSLYACLISDDEYYRDVVEYWSNVYGFKMGPLANMALCEASVEQVTADSLVSSSECVKVIDVKTCDKNYLPFESELQFKINRTCIVHGVTMFFTADFQNFDLVRTERLSTAPTDRVTHWKQSTLLLHKAMMVTAGDVIDCTVRFSRNMERLGRVDVSCSIFEQSHTYLL